MKILMIAENDPAGTAISFTNAINRYTAHHCRLVTKEIRYNFMFEKDIHIPFMNNGDREELEHLLRCSDVFHFHMTSDEYIQLGPFQPVDFLHEKLVIHHHHGHHNFRADPGKYRKKYKALKRSNLLVSTPDLLHLLPEARWQPNPVPINDLRYLPLDGKPNGVIKIVHSPTRKDLKNTNEIIFEVNELKARGFPVELELIENTEHSECLYRKRKCHILFDHLHGYYGVSSLEGLSQGLCVLAGLDKWNQMHIRNFTGQERIPWLITSTKSMGKNIIELVESGEKREETAAYSRRFMEKYWNEQAVTNRLVEFYRDAEAS